MHIISDDSRTLPSDVIDFIDILNSLQNHHLPPIRELFDEQSDLVVARAPGRMDLMGGIADYSGSLVLQLPIGEATLVAAQKAPDRTITIVSQSPDRQGNAAVFSMSLAELESNESPTDYTTASAWFQRDPERSWAAYIAGTFLVLMRERGLTFAQGARLFIHSDVPEGKGVSSSAAVEVASMTVIAALFGIEIEAREMALLCQKVENLVVGAPCGVMDQMTSVCGQENQLLSLLCQPAEIQPSVAISNDLAVWGIDSGIRHAVSGSDYTSVRVGAFMGYRILLGLAGLAPDNEIDDTSWGGYLANLTPSEFEQQYATQIPVTMQGSDFLAQYGSTTDTVTQVEPEQTYAVRQPTAHPIYEHFRVKTFSRLLQADSLANAPLLGECMYQSHASYSACGLGSEGTDELVRLARRVGPTQGIYGAKITGGGSGGTVAILGHRDAERAVFEIAQEYAKISNRDPYVFIGSSPGAAAFGHLQLQFTSRNS